VDDISMTFARSHFESAMYSHCSIFKRFRGASPLTVASCRASRVDEDPVWFRYQYDNYKVNLLALSRPELIAAARLIADRKSVARKKDNCVKVILNHFCNRRAMLSAMNTDDLLDHLSSRSVPLGCTRFRTTVLAAEFQALYGESLASVLRTPPPLQAFFDMETAALRASEVMSLPWIRAPLHVLTRNLEKLSSAAIQTCLDNLPPPRSVFKMRSHRKTCNALANHIRLRAISLFLAGPSTMADVFTTHFPFHPYTDAPDTFFFLQILNVEFGSTIISQLSLEWLSSSAQRRIDRAEHRQHAIEEAIAIRDDRATQWPSPVPHAVVLDCLNKYMDGSKWCEPPVCAVCSCYARDVVSVPISDDLSPYNLDLLRISDEFIIRKCVLQGMSSCFTFGNDKIDGLMLAKDGLIFNASVVEKLHICPSCMSFLTKHNIPRFALANNLFRGMLPVQFSDLTWVEEKVCAIYSVTAHITRLFQSSDPAQPKVFHGNTCAHDMNVISTVSVLPRTPADINGFISVVFIGPEKFDPKKFATLFRVRKHKIWNFLLWLRHHNRLYADITLDPSVVDMYPSDGALPGLCESLVEDRELDAQSVFDIETAGFTPHPAELLKEGSKLDETVPVMIEKMGVSDPECDRVSGRQFVASALRNLRRDHDASDMSPDLVIHHGADAVPEYNNPFLFPGMFPTLFPLGIGGFEDKERSTALSFELQAKYFFMISDRSFRYHYSFMFIVFNIIQRRQAHLHTYFTVNKSKFETIARKLTSVPPSVLQRLADQLERESTLSNLSTEERDALSLLHQVKTLSARIPGSQASKIFVRNEIRNYFAYFGLPHIFLTFNPSAAHSPIFQVMFGDSSVDLSQRLPCMPSSSVRALRLAQDPVAAADFFEFSFQCLFRYLLGWDFDTCQCTAKGGILGHMRAFYGTTEFTERGGLHGHFLIWLDGGINPAQLHERLRGDDDYQARFFAFFENAIHHHLPDLEDDVDPTFMPQVQRPPQPPHPNSSEDDLSVWDRVFATEIKRCGEALQRHSCRAVCHKYGNSDRCRFLFPHEIVDASYFDPSTNAVVLMCRDGTVNYFNPYILVFCRHNHDIKCILSGKGAKAAMFYISDYITKMDVKTYEMLSLLSRAVARMPDSMSGTSVVDRAKTLLHKCLSQFNRQQQIHAQQAARYIQGFTDGVCSHQTVAMLSSSLLSYVKDTYSWVAHDNVNCETDCSEDDDETEHVQLRIATDKNGLLLDTNQIQHYICRSDSLMDMSFYDFCRCVRVERKSVSANIKNINDPRVFKRHPFVEGHPLCDSHELVEHTSVDHGHLRTELVPRVVGMSIPTVSNRKMWCLFALAHFKPFSISRPLLSDGEDVIKAYESYSFSSRSKEIMLNWDAVNECEDERDAERLRKRAHLTAESKVLTSALALDEEDDGCEFALFKNSSKRAEDDFRIQQTVLLLQQSNWLTRQASIAQKPTSGGFLLPVLHDPTAHITNITPFIKSWLRQIKQQEIAIRNARRNALNPDQQLISTEVCETECTAVQDVSMNFVDQSSSGARACPATDALKVPGMNISDDEIVSHVASEFGLNDMQCIAYHIIVDVFLKKFVNKVSSGVSGLEGTSNQLIMLMTGPGGTGKTHVVKAVQTVMREYGCAHFIRFLAPTGSAAALIDGMTIHKGLGIKIKSSNKGKGNRDPGVSSQDLSILVTVQNRSQLRDEWRNVEFLFIDEVSLLSLQLLAEIDHALRFAKERPDLWFGGIVIIFAGDFYQYPPVGGSPLYTPISAYAGQNDAEIKKRLGRMAWKMINTVISLTEQQRMKGDQQYGEAVSRLRNRSCNQHDVDLFNSRVVKSVTNPSGIDMGSTENIDATAIVTSNEMREVLNAKKAAAACNGDLLVCAAQDKSSTELSEDERNQLLRLNITTLKSMCALPGFVLLFEGMPVILRIRNLATDLAITNGSQGIVRRIFTNVSPAGLTHASCVLVEFPHSKVHLSDLPKGYFPILPCTWTFTTLLDGDDGSQKKVRITRSQLPIQPAFAVTGHSAQGKTLPQVLVDLNQGGFAAYVAASRAQSRQGLFLTQTVSIEQLNKCIPTDLFMEVKRFDAIEHNTLVRQGVREGQIKLIPDAEAESTLMTCPIRLNFHSSSDSKVAGRKRSHAAIDATDSDGQESDSIVVSNKPTKSPRMSVDVADFTLPLTDTLSRDSHIPAFAQPHHTESISSSGCRWSSQNWSCAYDCVFMVLFYVYRGGSLAWCTSWRTLGHALYQLAMSFEALMASDINLHSSASFDCARDKMRDLLSENDPVRFARYGPHFTSVVSILENLFQGFSPGLLYVNGRGATDSNGLLYNCVEVLSYTLPSLCSRLRWMQFDCSSISLQGWINLFLQRECAKENGRRSLSSSLIPIEDSHAMEHTRVVLQSTPPMLYFEVVSTPTCTFLPSVELVLPTLNGCVTYNLRGILYFGDQHFTARLFLHGRIWVYDGQINEGTPVLDDHMFSLGSDGFLSRLSDHDAIVYLYCME